MKKHTPTHIHIQTFIQKKSRKENRTQTNGKRVGVSRNKNMHWVLPFKFQKDAARILLSIFLFRFRLRFMLFFSFSSIFLCFVVFFFLFWCFHKTLEGCDGHRPETMPFSFHFVARVIQADPYFLEWAHNAVHLNYQSTHRMGTYS